MATETGSCDAIRLWSSCVSLAVIGIVFLPKEQGGGCQERETGSRVQKESQAEGASREAEFRRHKAWKQASSDWDQLENKNPDQEGPGELCCGAGALMKAAKWMRFYWFSLYGTDLYFRNLPVAVRRH